MKLRILPHKNPLSIYRYIENLDRAPKIEDDQDDQDEGFSDQELADSGIPGDMGNRMSSPGRIGDPKTDKFQGIPTPPMQI